MFDIQGRAFVVVKHTYFESPGTPEAELVDYLRGKASSILYIRHPFPDSTKIPLKTTALEYDSNGGLIYEKSAPSVGKNPLFSYFKDVFLSAWYVLRSGRRYDLYIGADNLNCLAGIILRFLGRTRKVVYYVIDFSPRRFSNRFLNSIYQGINKFCCYHADYIWNVSERMVEGRESIGIKAALSAPQITVPLGCDFHNIPRKPPVEADRFKLVYFGMLRGEHGPGLILESLPLLAVRHPEIKVVFAGEGELKKHLKRRAEESGVETHVEFAGFLESEQVYELLLSCGLALATYPPEEGTYKAWSDPGKVKIYLASGLPVLITDVPAIAKEIERRKAGKIVEYDANDLADKISAIFSDAEIWQEMRSNAIVLASEYKWKKIWEKAFSSMENNLIK